MKMIFSVLLRGSFLLFFLLNATSFANNQTKIAILTYHNFDPVKPGIMTITPAKFEQQLKWLKDNGYHVIPLKVAVLYLQGKRNSLPDKSVVITADDGRQTVYTYMLPLVRKYNVPVTLFIYPISISHASYALTWEQIKEMQNTKLFDVQGHTYWHPNFNQEKKNLKRAEYEKLVHVQLFNSKTLLEKKLGTPITLLAWPYGIYNKYLEGQAKKAGYAIAFSIDDRKASRTEKLMAEPRYMVSQKHSMKTFAAMVTNHYLTPTAKRI